MIYYVEFKYYNIILNKKLGWLMVLSYTDGDPGFEPSGGTGNLSGCSLQGLVELIEVRVS